ncbi:hypothetical protein EBT31_06465 [bacterium]|jgi:hypothetical protein|nr:hypothetical protein [bacterium]NBX48608.1 hypothetical protein [bacterium]
METMTSLFTAWEETINQYRDQPNVEIEIRLGKVNRGKFDTNVGQQTFEKVLRRLRKFDGWESKSETQTTVYSDPNTSKRVTMNDTTDEMEASVIKKRLFVNDQVLPGFPVDARLGISSEVPYDRDADTDENFTRVKKRKRYSFVRKGLSIDLTEVSGDADDKDSEEATEYQIELEILNPPVNIAERHQLFNIVYKISDICKIMI